MSEEKKFYSFNEILKFIGIPYEFEKNNKEYPFNRGVENVTFGWGQILIPKKGIREVVQNKISDIKEIPLKEIVMMYQMPFVVNFKNKVDTGIINQNISLGFRYGKEWKYGDINKSIYEVCFYILEHSRESNDFYIIGIDYIHDFFSYYIIDNQWGLGAMYVETAPIAKFYPGKEPEENEDTTEVPTNESSEMFN